ncbi:hypothetical protein N431DRAFT_472230 [Stipitochalara longipes BDJ]|nr:hypothetical protein N431DRAFT_472230 [Stipitochalara longipes BDJ]
MAFRSLPNLSTSEPSPNLHLKFRTVYGIPAPEKTPFIEKVADTNASILPTKAFERPRRAANAQHVVWQSLVILPLIIVPIVLVEICVYPAIQYVGNLPFYDCTYSGVFAFQGIDLAFGRMTYAQAKGIDLIWNTIAGRGLQAVLSAIAYKAFTQALMRISERDAIPYELFCVLGVFTTSRKALWPLLKATFSKLTQQTRFILIWLLISTGYLLLFPTLIDAVSGYQAIQMTWLKLYNGSTVDLTHGLLSDSGNYMTEVIPRECPSLDSLNITWESQQDYFTGTMDGSSPGFYEIYFSARAMFPDHHAYVAVPVCINSTVSQLWFTNTTAGDGTDTLSGKLLSYADSSCGDWFRLLEPGDPYSSVYDPIGAQFFFNQTFLSQRANYECVSQDIYQWGFSYAWLLLTSCINAIWFFGTWIILLDSEHNSELMEKGRKLGTWRTILDLAESLNRDLGPQTCAYTEKEIEDAIKRQRLVRYRVDAGNGGAAHIGLSSSEIGRKPFKLDWDQEYGG